APVRQRYRRRGDARPPRAGRRVSGARRGRRREAAREPSRPDGGRRPERLPGAPDTACGREPGGGRLVRAALVSQYKVAPSVAERPAPTGGDGNALIELRAAGLNPVDLTVASGTFPMGSPPVPYVPGVEAVGSVLESERLAAGTRVYVSGGG